MQACMQNGLELDKNEINCLLYGSTPNHINYFCFEIHKIFLLGSTGAEL